MAPRLCYDLDGLLRGQQRSANVSRTIVEKDDSVIVSAMTIRLARLLVAGFALLLLGGCASTPAATGPSTSTVTPTVAPAHARHGPQTALHRYQSTTGQSNRTAIALPRHVTPIPGWLHTGGTRIVDAHGRGVVLAAINWYGAEGPDFVPGGLDRRPYMDVLLTIKALGFNAVRLPFSNELVERNPRVFKHLEANRALIGKHALEIMDAIVAGARRAGLMVILDDHRSDAGWSAHGNGLWYTAQYPESAWIRDWVTLARRYQNNPAVIGADLRNEPHSNGPGTEILALGYLRQGATWGPYHGVDNPKSDWRLAAERAGDAVLRANPHWLIFVEGTEIYPNANGTPDIYWWGADLRGAMQYPVRLALPHHLVYAPHEYGPQMHSQRWFTPHMTARQWDQQFTKHWGYLLNRTGPDAAPVWIGEFGTPHRSNLDIVDTRPVSQGQWFSALVQYIARHHIGWAYWAINGSMSSGPFGRHYGAADSFGVLTPDWQRLSRPLLMRKLATIEQS